MANNNGEFLISLLPGPDCFLKEKFLLDYFFLFIFDAFELNWHTKYYFILFLSLLLTF
jgi:hypothetical protein